MEKCPVCKEEISPNSKECPYCHFDLRPVARMKELPSYYFNEAIRLAHEGRYTKAIEQLMIASTLNKTDAEIFVLLGKLYALTGQLDLADESWQQALRIDPTNQKAKAGIERLSQIREQNVREEQNRKRSNQIKKFSIITVSSAIAILLFLGVTLQLIKVSNLDPVTKIEQTWKQNRLIASLNISAISKDRSFISLEGNVPTEAHKELAVALANHAVPKRKIVDNITVKEPLPSQTIPHVQTTSFVYFMQRGDTLYKLAKIFYNDANRWKEIYEDNKDVFNEPTLIPIGTPIKIRLDQKASN